jgi:hypothetical protein
MDDVNDPSDQVCLAIPAYRQAWWKDKMRPLVDG